MYPWQNQGRMPPRATVADFHRAAGRIGCSVGVIRAVWQVEAAGRPFRNDGSLERRFEPHHYPSSKWGAIGFSVKSGEAPWRASLRLSNDTMANKAYDLDANGMLRATSFGGPQIMGFNAADAGFASAREMVDAMNKSEGQQLDAFVTLVLKWGLGSALRAKDWATFARRYNGPGQVSHYANLLERAYGVTSTDKHAAALEAAVRGQTGQATRVVLRLGSEGASVRALQKALGIKVDGVFGQETRRTVINFQTKNKLTADGVVGDKTWTAMQSMGLLSGGVGTQAASTGTVETTAAATIATVAAGLGLTDGGSQSVGLILAMGIAAGAVWYFRRRAR